MILYRCDHCRPHYQWYGKVNRKTSGFSFPGLFHSGAGGGEGEKGDGRGEKGREGGRKGEKEKEDQEVGGHGWHAFPPPHRPTRWTSPGRSRWRWLLWQRGGRAGRRCWLLGPGGCWSSRSCGRSEELFSAGRFPPAGEEMRRSQLSFKHASYWNQYQVHLSSWASAELSWMYI